MSEQTAASGQGNEPTSTAATGITPDRGFAGRPIREGVNTVEWGDLTPAQKAQVAAVPVPSVDDPTVAAIDALRDGGDSDE